MLQAFTKAITAQLGTTLSGVGVAAIDGDFPQVGGDLRAGSAWFGGEIRLAFDADRMVYASWEGGYAELVFREHTLHRPEMAVAKCEWEDVLGKRFQTAEFLGSDHELLCAKLTFADAGAIWLAVGGHDEVGKGNDVYLGTLRPKGSDRLEILETVKATVQ